MSYYDEMDYYRNELEYKYAGIYDYSYIKDEQEDLNLDANQCTCSNGCYDCLDVSPWDFI